MIASNNTLSNLANFTPPTQTSLLCAERCKAGETCWQCVNCRMFIGVRSRYASFPEFQAEWADFRNFARFRRSGRQQDISYFSDRIVARYALFSDIYSVSQPPPHGFLKFFPKLLGIFNQFFTYLLHDPVYARLQILFNYFQLWRNYAILSATTQRIFTFH